jgi:hypothetical protein
MSIEELGELIKEVIQDNVNKLSFDYGTLFELDTDANVAYPHVFLESEMSGTPTDELYTAENRVFYMEFVTLESTFEVSNWNRLKAISRMQQIAIQVYLEIRVRLQEIGDDNLRVVNWISIENQNYNKLAGVRVQYEFLTQNELCEVDQIY